MKRYLLKLVGIFSFIENGLTKKQQELADLKVQVMELREQGLSMQQIANKLEINKTKVVRLSK